MISSLSRMLLPLLVVLPGLSQGQNSEVPPQGAAVPAKCLQIFDSLYYTAKTGTRGMNMRPLQPAGALNWWPDRKNTLELPRQADVERWIRKLPRRDLLLAIDLEHWPLRGTHDEMAKVVERYVTLVQWVRQSDYRGPIGFYGLLPLRDYWRAVTDISSTEYRQWQAENDVYRPLAEAVDVLLPSIYTFYDDIAGWERYATANIREAKRLAPTKPVYPFIWPQFHNSNEKLGYQFISGDMWARELQTIALHADGVVLWGSDSGWDLQAPWWQVTRSFVRDNGCPVR